MRLRGVLWNPWESNGKLRNMKNQSFEVLFHKQIRNTRCMGSCSFHPAGNHSSFHPGRNSIRLPPLSTRMYHIWNSASLPFHLAAAIPSGCRHSIQLLPLSTRMSRIQNFAVAAIPSECLTSEILTPDERG